MILHQGWENGAAAVIRKRQRSSETFTDVLLRTREQVCSMAVRGDITPDSLISNGGWTAIISATFAALAEDQTLPGSKLFGDAPVALLIEAQDIMAIRNEAVRRMRGENR